MYVEDFPGCCNAHVVWGFGGSRAGQRVKHDIGIDELTTELKGIIKEHGEYRILVVTTNNEQVAANRVLMEQGFARSEWIAKVHHPETKVRIWWRQPTKQPPKTPTTQRRRIMRYDG